MRLLRHLGLALIALALASCVASLHGIYDDKTLVASDEILGAWKSDEGGAHFLFTRDAERPFYKLVYFDEKARPMLFRAALARIGGKLYLDVIPAGPEALGRNGFLALHVLLWHSFAQADVSHAELRLRLPDPVWLDKYLAAHPEALPHFRDRGELYLTAETPALQAFVAEHDAFFEAKPRLFSRE